MGSGALPISWSILAFDVQRRGTFVHFLSCMLICKLLTYHRSTALTSILASSTYDISQFSNMWYSKKSSHSQLRSSVLSSTRPILCLKCGTQKLGSLSFQKLKSGALEPSSLTEVYAYGRTVRKTERCGERGNLKADDVRLHVADLSDDALMTTGHVPQLMRTVEVFTRFDGVV